MNTKRIDVVCDFNISKLCKRNCNMDCRAYKQNLIRNNGKFRCLYCGIASTHKQENSHYFKYKKKNDYFNNINSDIKAYLLGILAGDGHITKKTIGLCANSKDIETINKFIKEIFINCKPTLTKNRNCFSVTATSDQLVNDVCLHLNVLPGKKSNKITLPTLNNQLLWAFIRGLFDTDGCVINIHAKTQSPRCFYSSTSKKILLQVQEFCLKENIIGNISGIKLQFNGINAINFMEKIYKDSDNHLTRKYEMFKLWQTWSPRKGHKFKTFSTKSKKRKLSNDDVIFILKNKHNMLGKKLAEMFNISPSTIYDILNRKLYKEITI